MPDRRSMLKHSATVAGLLALTGLWPRPSQADPSAAFEAKQIDAALAALGSQAPVESRQIMLSGPDFAENGASVPLGGRASGCSCRIARGTVRSIKASRSARPSAATAPWWRRGGRRRWPAPGRSGRPRARRSPAPR